MEMSCQLHDPATLLPRNEPLLPIGWAPESVWKEKFPAPAWTRIPDHPALYHWAILAPVYWRYVMQNISSYVISVQLIVRKALAMNEYHICNTACARKSNGFWNLQTSLPATRCFLTDSHPAQCCLKFSWHGKVSVCIGKFFHCILKHYFISKTVRCFWHTLHI
jgi:hypothetical protein